MQNLEIAGNNETDVTTGGTGSTGTTGNNGNTLTGVTLTIYQQITPIVDELVGVQKITASLFRPLLLQLIRVVEGSVSDILDDSEKKQLALAVLDYIIKDLKNSGKISSPIAEGILIGLEFLGPSLVDFATNFINKVETIEKNGCSGCVPKKSKATSNKTITKKK